MSNEEKQFNEMMKSLGRQENQKSLRAPKLLRTDVVKPISWKTVEVGQLLSACKGYIPSDSICKPRLINSSNEAQCIHDVEQLLFSVSIIQGPDGVSVNLNTPETSSEGSTSLHNRAVHLCGKRIGEMREFDATKAEKAGCIPETIQYSSLIAKHGSEFLYLRRYKGGMLHVVVVGEHGQIKDQAFQTIRDLVTQYAPNPTYAFAQARVIFKNAATKGKK